MTRDGHLTPVRGETAAASLQGLVPAKRYLAAKPMRTRVPATAIHAAADPNSQQVDQLLFGEVFDVLEAAEGFTWGQARRDGYVGFVCEGALAAADRSPTHWVSALRTFAFEHPSIKAPLFGPLSLNALVAVDAEEGSLAHADGAGWIPKRHLSEVGVVLDDPASIAEMFLGAPYVWGGRDSLGLDCSGLVQQALYACGRRCARDTDQQARQGVGIDAHHRRRGDLVFWSGHVAMLLDAERIIHANAHHMAVAIEPLGEAITRIAASSGQPTDWRRL